jgi:hypothetical protein
MDCRAIVRAANRYDAARMPDPNAPITEPTRTLSKPTLRDSPKLLVGVGILIVAGIFDFIAFAIRYTIENVVLGLLVVAVLIVIVIAGLIAFDIVLNHIL